MSGPGLKIAVVGSSQVLSATELRLWASDVAMAGSSEMNQTQSDSVPHNLMGEIDPGTATNSSAQCIMLALASDVPRTGRMILIDLWRLQSTARWSWAVKKKQHLHAHVITSRGISFSKSLEASWG